MKIRYFREYDPLGTGGGFFHFREQIKRSNCDKLIVMHSDIACAFPLQKMLDFHQDKKTLCTVLGKRVSASFNEFGCIVPSSDHRVLHYVEKPSTFVSDIVSCGIYVFDIAVFDFISSNLTADFNDFLRLENDVLSPLAERGELYMYEMNDFWLPISSPSYNFSNSSSLIPASKLYLKESVSISDSAKVDLSAQIGPNVSIGSNCKIGAGVRISDSIILSNVEIEDFSNLKYSIVGSDCRISKWCRIEGRFPQDSNQQVTKNGVKSDSVTILAGSNFISQEVAIRNCIMLTGKEAKKSYHNEILM